MRKVISIMFFAVLGIALSAFAPTKQEIETECTTTWEQGDTVAGPGGCTTTQWTEVKTCNGVTTRRTMQVSNCLNYEPVPINITEASITISQFDPRVENMVIHSGDIVFSDQYNIYSELATGGWIAFKVESKEEKDMIIRQVAKKLTGKTISADPIECSNLVPVNSGDPNTKFRRTCCYSECDPICLCWYELCDCGYCVCKVVEG